MNKDHIIATSREISIKDNRANNVSVRMGESFCALALTTIEIFVRWRQAEPNFRA